LRGVLDVHIVDRKDVLRREEKDVTPDVYIILVFVQENVSALI